MTPLCEIANEFKCDKFMPHQYTGVYYRLLSDRIDATRSVLEVGIGKGRSLRMWEQFFPHAVIHGIDNQPHRLIDAGRIKSYLGDQADEAQMREIASSIGGKFDIIIDDGAHDARRQILAMEALLPFVAKGGFYFIEDIRDEIGSIIKSVPAEFSYEVFEGNKKLPSGCGERLMILQWR